MFTYLRCIFTLVSYNQKWAKSIWNLFLLIFFLLKKGRCIRLISVFNVRYSVKKKMKLIVHHISCELYDFPLFNSIQCCIQYYFNRYNFSKKLSAHIFTSFKIDGCVFFFPISLFHIIFSLFHFSISVLLLNFLLILGSISSLIFFSSYLDRAHSEKFLMFHRR